jgi:hypothetical protein
MKFCTYITFYHGNKLPPFYIGSSSIKKIEDGYVGSVSSIEYKKIWQKEVRENRSAFKVIIVSRHHTRPEAFERENDLQRKLNVVESMLYANKSYASPDPKSRWAGRIGCTAEMRAKISETARNRSVEEKERLSLKLADIAKSRPKEKLAPLIAAAKNKTEDTRRKLSAARLGKVTSPETKAKLAKASGKAVVDSNGNRFDTKIDALKYHHIGKKKLACLLADQTSGWVQCP